MSKFKRYFCLYEKVGQNQHLKATYDMLLIFRFFGLEKSKIRFFKSVENASKLFFENQKLKSIENMPKTIIE